MSEEETKPTENLPAVSEESPRATEEGLIAHWHEDRVNSITSLDLESDNGKSDYLRGLQKADHGGQDSCDVELRVRDYIVHPITIVDPLTGEERTMLRLVLFLTNGQTIGTCGIAVIKAWRHAVHPIIYGPGPWENPLTLVLSKVKGTGPYSYLIVKQLTRTRQEDKGKKK